ncbi:MAG: Ni/Fe hydrogenase subunit alpha [Candidatus Promineifilaceae bacterium]|nr:nickel-dependent hydrogenase large subunit [Pseudomonadota bacterium]
MTDSGDRTIRVPVLARVEGEGALDLIIRGDRIEQLQLRIFEPPRLFEKLLEGRPYTDVPDIVARICGICPVAYQMSAVHAIEQVFQLNPGPWVREMRRLMYCGEWIESHALHVHLLALPDFLGADNVIELAERYPDEVRRGLHLQGLGNRLLRLVGGRSVHPVSTCIGGLSHAPTPAEIAALLDEFRQALPMAEALLAWTASLDLPDEQQDFTSVALRHADEYPMNEGRLVSSAGLDIPIQAYQDHFREYQVPHSTALQSSLDGQPYLVGPLARINLNLDRLPQDLQQQVAACGITFPSRNMFHSLTARAIEVVYAMGEAIRIMAAYQLPDSSRVDVTPRAGIGFGCTEAPRGILWHTYELDADGQVQAATIVPPTSQNQARIEDDLRNSLTAYGLHRSDDELRKHGETVIRNYDPCISCSTHFLKIKVGRE